MNHKLESTEKIERAVLALADGRVFYGRPYGARGKVVGEVVFCTSMTGYQEILTDPSYCSQIIVMTAPQIGNVGSNPEDAESRKIWASGFIIKEPSPIPSNYRSQMSLSQYLKNEGTVSLFGIDTRALTRHIRDRGAMMAVLQNTGEINVDELVEEAKKSSPIESRDLVKEVSTKEVYRWETPSHSLCPKPNKKAKSVHIVVYDFGVKLQTLRFLYDRGCSVSVVPATASAKEVLDLKPDGILLSNGPGDPSRCDYAIKAIQELLGKIPIFGICLGHQILSLALGGKTQKMRFGHRGANQPVSFLGKVAITSQNHGFEVLSDSFDSGVKIWQHNLSDGLVEGIFFEEAKVFSVQYHPEASPGPHDTLQLFDRFLSMIPAN